MPAGFGAVANEVEFVPEWGKHRIAGMLDSRPDWCISRQRAWGLPIPVFYNDKGDAVSVFKQELAVRPSATPGEGR